MIRVDNMYNTTPGHLAANDLTDAKKAQCHDFRVLADVSLSRARFHVLCTKISCPWSFRRVAT